jgi:uncharacterized protein
MLLQVPLAELAWLAIAILLAGILTGIFAGLFGIGGGAVIVPVLYEAFRLLGVPEDVRMQLCIGTSLGIIVPTTIRSFLAHRVAGKVMARVLRAWTLPATAGVAVGAVAAAYAPGGVFKLAFVVFAAAIAAKLLFGRAAWVIAHDLPGRAPMAAYGFVVGLASALMGISGGSLSTIVLTLYGQSIQSAVASRVGPTEQCCPRCRSGSFRSLGLSSWRRSRAMWRPTARGWRTRFPGARSRSPLGCFCSLPRCASS